MSPPPCETPRFPLGVGNPQLRGIEDFVPLCWDIEEFLKAAGESMVGVRKLRASILAEPVRSDRLYWTRPDSTDPVAVLPLVLLQVCSSTSRTKARRGGAPRPRGGRKPNELRDGDLIAATVSLLYLVP